MATRREKPDFVGPEGGNDTLPGFTPASAGYTGGDGELSTGITQCQNVAAYPNFFATSAAPRNQVDVLVQLESA